MRMNILKKMEEENVKGQKVLFVLKNQSTGNVKCQKYVNIMILITI